MGAVETTNKRPSINYVDLLNRPYLIKKTKWYKQKLSHNFLLHFQIDMGSYDNHAKHQGVFQVEASIKHFFHKGPPLWIH